MADAEPTLNARLVWYKSPIEILTKKSLQRNPERFPIGPFSLHSIVRYELTIATGEVIWICRGIGFFF